MTNEDKSNAPIVEVDGREETAVGNYFVSNYPPFSFWSDAHLPGARGRLAQAPAAETPFGLYVHIPFCRKRCDFCYFRVYTGRDAKHVDRYVDAVLKEAAMYTEQPSVGGRAPEFVYFGGGTPSFLSPDQMRRLFDGLRSHWSWDSVREVTFEAEPGTLDREKIETLRELGVTRISLGVENFDAGILELNNRAHRAKEIDVAYEACRAVGFEQVNIDLIAGMVGETEANWQRCIERTREMAPDSVTIYQMEFPFNTTISRRMKDDGETVAPVADWATKRRWVADAFAALEEDGYVVGSAYTAKKPDAEFLYRDGLWFGADLLGLGVASFSHIGGWHIQNDHDLDPYCETVEAGELPLHRALPLSEDEKLIRQFVLQLKLGRVSLAYFQRRYGVDVRERFAAGLAKHQAAGHLGFDGDDIVIPRESLLVIDLLLQEFFNEEHKGARYE